MNKKTVNLRRIGITTITVAASILVVFTAYFYHIGRITILGDISPEYFNSYFLFVGLLLTTAFSIFSACALYQTFTAQEQNHKQQIATSINPYIIAEHIPHKCKEDIYGDTGWIMSEVNKKERFSYTDERLANIVEIADYRAILKNKGLGTAINVKCQWHVDIEKLINFEQLNKDNICTLEIHYQNHMYIKSNSGLLDPVFYFSPEGCIEHKELQCLNLKDEGIIYLSSYSILLCKIAAMYREKNKGFSHLRFPNVKLTLEYSDLLGNKYETTYIYEVTIRNHLDKERQITKDKNFILEMKMLKSTTGRVGEEKQTHFSQFQNAPYKHN